jgi:hypothetical protein
MQTYKIGLWITESKLCFSANQMTKKEEKIEILNILTYVLVSGMRVGIAGATAPRTVVLAC